MDNPRPATCTPAELLQWQVSRNLEMTPKFQRKAVWTAQQRSYLIDTILQGMPVPPIYLRNIYDPEKKRLVRQVIDGQQRLKAVLDFVEEEYAISKSLPAEYAGKRFGALTKKQQTAIMNFTFTYQAFDAISDAEVYEVFRRMNTYSSPLTRQELRHGRWFGYFSQSCENLAKDHLEFWRKNNILSETTIVRMGEVQFTSSLLIAQIDGMQNKNDAIDRFYEEYDEHFPSKSQHEKRFRTVIDQITEILGDRLIETQFRRPPFFYTLFCAVYHRLYQLPKVALRTPKRALKATERDSLSDAVLKLSGVIHIARERIKQKVARETAGGKSVDRPRYPSRFNGFVAACLSGTDNKQPRETRLHTLYTEAFTPSQRTH